MKKNDEKNTGGHVGGLIDAELAQKFRAINEERHFTKLVVLERLVAIWVALDEDTQIDLHYGTFSKAIDTLKQRLLAAEEQRVADKFAQSPLPEDAIQQIAESVSVLLERVYVLRKKK